MIMRNEDAMLMEVKFTCPHVDWVHVFGEIHEIYAQVDAMEAHCICPECMLDKFGKLPYIDYEKAVEMDGRMNLPPLRGTYRQIHWAVTLRAQIFTMPDELIWFAFKQEGIVLSSIPRYHDLCHDMFAEDFKNVKRKEKRHLWAMLTKEIRDHQEASWWIDGQKHCLRELVHSLLRKSLDDKIYKGKRESVHIWTPDDAKAAIVHGHPSPNYDETIYLPTPTPEPKQKQTRTKRLPKEFNIF